ASRLRELGVVDDPGTRDVQAAVQGIRGGAARGAAEDRRGAREGERGRAGRALTASWALNERGRGQNAAPSLHAIPRRRSAYHPLNVSRTASTIRRAAATAARAVSSSGMATLPGYRTSTAYGSRRSASASRWDSV